MSSLARTRSVASDGRHFFLVMLVVSGLLTGLGGVRWVLTSWAYDPQISQGVLFARAVTDGHEAMLDQETGLRGYQILGDPEYLQPYRSGQGAYQQASAQVWQRLPSADLRDDVEAWQAAALRWQVDFAVPHLALTSPGSPERPQPTELARGKALFDAYRAAYTSLLRRARTHNSGLLEQRAVTDRAASGLETALAGTAVVLAARRRRRLRSQLVAPVERMAAVLGRLAAGEDSARLDDRSNSEFAAVSDSIAQLGRAAAQRREDAEAERRASGDRVATYERVLAVAQDLGSCVDPVELGAALLHAVQQVAAVETAVLAEVDDGVVGAVLASAPEGLVLPDDGSVREALRRLQATAGADGLAWAVPVVHASTVHGLLHVRLARPLDDDGLLALRNLALAAGGAMTAARLYGQVREESRRDALTGLNNRRRFEEDVRQELGLAGRTGVPVTLLLLDVDHFKRYNDTRGHREGDRLLRDLAGLLALTLRATDSAYRYGGEELAVLLRGTPQADATALAERLRGVVESRTPVTVSVGLVSSSRDVGADRLVEAADAALYQAKHDGRNAVRQRDLTAAPVLAQAALTASA